jgi:hypothetical protein
MRPIIYIRPRTAWRLIKVVAWFVALSVFSAHRGAGSGVFIAVTVVYIALKLWARSRPPVVEDPPEPVKVAKDDALRMLRALHYLRSVAESQEPSEPAESQEPPEQIQARRLP